MAHQNCHSSPVDEERCLVTRTHTTYFTSPPLASAPTAAPGFPAQSLPSSNRVHRGFVIFCIVHATHCIRRKCRRTIVSVVQPCLSRTTASALCAIACTPAHFPSCKLATTPQTSLLQALGPSAYTPPARDAMSALCTARQHPAIPTSRFRSALYHSGRNKRQQTAEATTHQSHH